jgi:L-alanine-DL-glutamate epimerase-like enolase superfamily enzyme
VLHNCSIPVSAQVVSTLPVRVSPILEYPYIGNNFHDQYFFKNPLKPVNGMINLPSEPGLFELNEDKIEECVEVFS